MGRRTITEKEIALIKAMLSRGMKNRSIQFFFNRPDRPVNSGRISTIRSESYSNSREISAASERELDSFISSFQQSAGSITTAPEIVRSEPTVSEKARALFRKTKDGAWVLTGGEHEECECKRDFDPKKITSIVRAVAALANNKGGYIFFGVSNSGYQVKGISDVFSQIDIVQIIEKVKAHLSPTPSISLKDIIEFDGRCVGFLHVAKYQNPPIIVYRDGDGLNEGEILFRYPGQSSRIKFGDLHAILEERDRRAQLALANAAEKIADIGTGNAMILDTNRNVLEAKGHSILIDQKLAESLKFVKEGEFDERLGAPTLKLVGEVTPVTVKGAKSTIVAQAAIFQEDILEKFLEQAKVHRPIQYIYATLAQSRLWLPVFYYVRMSGKSNEEVARLVAALKISQKGKKKFLLERLERRRSPFGKAVTQAATRIADEISKGAISIPSSIGEVAPFAQGLTAVKKTTASLQDLLVAVQKAKAIAEAADDGNAMGAVFKAACWLDELFFGG